MGRLGNVGSNHAPHANSLDSKGFHVMGTMGMMFPCVSLVEKNDVFPIQEILPHPAHAPEAAGKNISDRICFLLIRSPERGTS